MIEDMMIEAMEKFEKECFREIEIESTKNELKNTLKEKRQREEEETRRKEREQEETNSWFTKFIWRHFDLQTVIVLLITFFVTYLFLSRKMSRDKHLKNNINNDNNST